MKLLVITNHSYMFWQFRKELMERLNEEHEVVLVTPFVGHEDDFAKMGLRCIETKLERRGMNPLHDFQLIKTYYRILRQEKPDLVITYSIKPNVYAGMLCGFFKIPYFVNVQGLGTAFQSDKMASLATILYKCGLRKVEKVFFENQGNAEEFLERGIVTKDKVRVLHGAGVNPEHYAYKPYPAEREQIHFLYLGRIMREKGIDELFYAMRKLHDKYGDRAVLDLVGFYEDAYKAEVEALCEQGIVVFHGFQSETRPYYEAADCVVLASYHEGMSNVILEAASCGRPVITSDIYGCREAVEDEQTGLLCRVRDSESLFACMDAFMGLSYEKRLEMGRKGREKMEREFAKHLVVEETVRELGL